MGLEFGVKNILNATHLGYIHHKGDIFISNLLYFLPISVVVENGRERNKIYSLPHIPKKTGSIVLITNLEDIT
jgi:hypothetical protein